MGSGLGEFWDSWIEIDKKEKEDLETMISAKVKQALQPRYNFPLDGEILQAVRDLEKLVVNRYRSIDFSAQDNFDRVWFSVLHEVDYYEEQEEGWNNLNKTTYKGAKSWLQKWGYLCNDGIPEEYKEA